MAGAGAAWLTAPSQIVIEGAVVYPEPAVVTVNESMVPLASIVAVPSARVKQFVVTVTEQTGPASGRLNSTIGWTA